MDYGANKMTATATAKRYEFEAFWQFGNSDIRRLQRDTPTHINYPDIYKYKVIIERVEKPKDNA